MEKPNGLKEERRSRERRTRKGQGVRRAREEGGKKRRRKQIGEYGEDKEGVRVEKQS